MFYIHNTITYYFHDFISTLHKQHFTNTKFSTPGTTSLHQMFSTLFPEHLIT